jgi:hypothetical protein
VSGYIVRGVFEKKKLTKTLLKKYTPEESATNLNFPVDEN